MASGQRLPILFLTHVVCLHLLLLEIVKVASTGNYFDCDPINKGRKCLCAHGETGVWDIQCPARILEVYPVTVKRKFKNNLEVLTVHFNIGQDHSYFIF